MNLRLRTEGLSWRQMDGEMVALDADASVYLGANETGTFLWERLAAGTTRTELVAALAEQWGLEAARAETDVDSFLDELREAGLLVEAGDGQS